MTHQFYVETEGYRQPVHYGPYQTQAAAVEAMNQHNAPLAHVVIDPVVTEYLTGWGTWDDLRKSVHALLFGQMVRRSEGIIKHYHSDLFHDAMWLLEMVHGPTTFDWLVREWGTNISDSASLWPGTGEPMVFYRIELFATSNRHTISRSTTGGIWQAKFTTVPPDQVKNLPQLPLPLRKHDDQT